MRRGAVKQARGDADIEDAARIVQRLAVLLSAGVSPVNAWGYLDEDAGPDASRAAQRGADRRRPRVNRAGGDSPAVGIRVVRAAGLAASRGDSVAEAIAGEARAVGGQSGEAWCAVAAAWEVATRSGAPLAACLRQLAASLRDLGQLHADLETALAGPAATARLVAVLPLVGILFGVLLGFNTVATLFLTVPGWLCLGSGTGLILAGNRWNRRLLRRARARAPTPGLDLDLTAIAMSGGGSVDRAQALVTEALGRYLPAAPDPHPERGRRSEPAKPGRSAALGRTARRGRSTDPGYSADPGRSAADRVLDLAVRAGVPAAELLRSEAEQLRRDARTAGQRRAVTLRIALLVPLGVCVLPAFMLLGVVPLLVTVLSTTLSEF
ncbi:MULTISPECIES: pilus assembly protein [Cryobacterium]|nr:MULTISPECIES: pilus assembly protein [Cryobacterium]TFC09214.1 pilus assembly protein [Cryobacterium sp. MDB2-33-2]